MVEMMMEFIMDSTDPDVIATEILGYLFDQGVTLTNLFELLSKNLESELQSLVDGLATGVIDAALNFILAADFIKQFTDAFVATGEYVILIKDLASMINSEKDFLIITYPISPI